MRLLAPSLLCLATACQTSAPIPAADPGTATEVGTDSASAEAGTEASSDTKPEHVFTPPAIPEGPHASVQGYGIELELYPPFQSARIGKWMDREHVDTLMWSWWDVTAPGSGRHGHAGLHNIIIVPGKPQPPGTALQTVKVEEGGEMVTALRYGDDGTEVRLAPGLTSIQGLATLRQGPARESWLWKGKGDAVEWPDRHFVHSADPSKGEVFNTDLNPHQPFGSWPK